MNEVIYQAIRHWTTSRNAAGPPPLVSFRSSLVCLKKKKKRWMRKSEHDKNTRRQACAERESRCLSTASWHGCREERSVCVSVPHVTFRSLVFDPPPCLSSTPLIHLFVGVFLFTGVSYSLCSLSGPLLFPSSWLNLPTWDRSGFTRGLS